jgi:hypothetical protein
VCLRGGGEDVVATIINLERLEKNRKELEKKEEELARLKQERKDKEAARKENEEQELLDKELRKTVEAETRGRK